MRDFKKLYTLSGTAEEEKWLRERLETLSAKEQLILTAAQIRQPAGSMAEAVRQLQSLTGYSVCGPARSYQELGELYLKSDTNTPAEWYPFANLERLGWWYEDQHPGLFLGKGYVEYPSRSQEMQAEMPWCVRLKLSSPSIPEGVWLRLPDREMGQAGRMDEVEMALDALGAQDLEECTLLEARCVLPEITGLIEGSPSLTHLVSNAQELGMILSEVGPGFMEQLRRTLAKKECHSLEEAIGIAKEAVSLDCDFSDAPKLFAKEMLRKSGVPEELVEQGYFDLLACGVYLEQKGTFSGDEEQQEQLAEMTM